MHLGPSARLSPDTRGRGLPEAPYFQGQAWQKRCLELSCVPACWTWGRACAGGPHGAADGRRVAATLPPAGASARVKEPRPRDVTPTKRGPGWAAAPERVGGPGWCGWSLPPQRHLHPRLHTRRCHRGPPAPTPGRAHVGAAARNDAKSRAPEPRVLREPRRAHAVCSGAPVPANPALPPRPRSGRGAPAAPATHAAEPPGAAWETRAPARVLVQRGVPVRPTPPRLSVRPAPTAGQGGRGGVELVQLRLCHFRK